MHMMTERRKHSWTQTLAIVIPLLITMIGLALAAEHRVTIVESGLQEMKEQTRLLGSNQRLVMETLAKVTTIQEMICDRHRIEDEKRNK
jgi:hypothetical protein